MKTISLAAPLLAFTLPSLAATAQLQRLRYAAEYSNAGFPSTGVACSEFLLSKDFPTLSSIPGFPNIGGLSTGGSPACGTCYGVTYSKTGNTVFVLIVDAAGDGFNVSQETMDVLTDGKAEELGVIEVKSYPVPGYFCGAWW